MYHHPFPILILAAIGLVPLTARGAPPEDAPKTSASPAAEKLNIQKVPFLGTATTQATSQQRAEAGLPSGVGLCVQHVLAGSPAETAGLQRYDVLHKLNDQLLINDPQFRVLLRTLRPGERIDLTFSRQAKPHTVTVQLGEKEVPLEELPPGELLRWLLRPASAVEPGDTAASFSASYEDDEHVLVLSTDAQGRHLLAKSKQGVVLFDNLVNTQEERSKVPDALRAKLKQLETPPKPQMTNQ
jgi:hypothetical protein